MILDSCEVKTRIGFAFAFVLGVNCGFILTALCNENFNASVMVKMIQQQEVDDAYKGIGPCHVSEIFLPLRVNSLPLATIYEVKIPLRKWKKSLLQRNPAQMTWPIV
jgi:hypothetical protein